jgi:hypothetical protein
MVINLKRAKAIRQALRKALQIPKIVSEYVTYVSKHKIIELPYESEQSRIAAGAPEGGMRLFRIEHLRLGLDPRCSRSLYRQTKRVATGRSFAIDTRGEATELWSPYPGFYPDSRALDITPKPAEPPDNSGGSGADDGMSEAVSADEQAQA